jgi:hypothetical protein
LLKPGERVIVEVVCILEELPRDPCLFVKLIDGLPFEWVAVDTMVITA